MFELVHENKNQLRACSAVDANSVVSSKTEDLTSGFYHD